MRPGAVMAVLLDRDRMLMIRRSTAVRRGGYWSAPGGMIEPGESQRDAIVRELREELGLEATPVSKVWECLTDDGRIRLHWWLVSAADQQLTPAPEEISATRWITPEEFSTLMPRFSAHEPFFRDVLPGLITPP
jgi:8-oxo-dGTP diphosphatase